VGEERDGLQEAVRVRPVRLARRAAVEVPARQLVERRLRVEVDDLRLAAEVRNGLVAVQPDVLELALHPSSSSSRTKQKGPRNPEIPEAPMPPRPPSAANAGSHPSRFC